MGWWRTNNGTTIGAPPANYLDSLKEVGLTYSSVQALPGEIRDPSPPRCAGVIVVPATEDAHQYAETLRVLA